MPRQVAKRERTENLTFSLHLIIFGTSTWLNDIQLGFIRFWRDPQPLLFVNIPSIILRPDKYNNQTNSILRI